ncbi:hypothetical protein DPMN_040434 [Dreissena polymorpha]|uniref:Uncharacterized protein n=1 Tax=Dreissena polymorpha TaxID=45954 RepID=A0A9D4CW12_DREPO|nr:hypothetical protein DPMN_040434 [Dreissena polymorpha]
MGFFTTRNSQNSSVAFSQNGEKKACALFYRISICVFERWLEQIPETWFGFTSIVKNFDRYQRDTLNLMKEYRLLLETDAPYFTLEGQPWSSPNQIYRTAQASTLT